MFLLQRTWTEMELLPLVCFYLLTCSGTTFGDEGTPVISRMVKLNGEVMLPCSLDSTDIRSDTFDWRKDAENNEKKEVFLYIDHSHYNNGQKGQDPQFKGRVFHFEDQLQSGNASIVIRNVKKTDSGRYSCIFPHHQPTTRSMIELIVDCILKDRTKENIPGSSPKPYVTNFPGTDDQALLECEVQGAFPKPKVQWLDSDNNTVPAEEPQVTESEGKFGIILKTTVIKTGYYRCVSTQEEICHEVYHEIYVNLNGAAPKPGITLQQTNGGVLLQCVAEGAFPKPKVVWKDGAGNILPAEEPEVTENKGRYNIILKTTVTKTDHYRCVSTQEEISHEVYTETHVFVPGPNTGLIAGVVFGVLFVLAVIIIIVQCIKQKSNTNKLEALRVAKPEAAHTHEKDQQNGLL